MQVNRYKGGVSMTIKKSTGRKNTFNYMIASYILVFLLPVLLIISFVQIYFINEMYQNAIKSSINDIVFTKNIMDNQIAQLFSIANSVFVDKEIMDSYHPRTQTSEVNALKTRLRILSLNAELPSETILYCVGDEYLFSTSSSISFKIFNFLNPIEDASSGEELQEILDNLTETKVLLPTEIIRTSNIIYAIPVKASGGKNKNKVILFIIQNSKFQELLQKMLSNNTGCAFVSDDNGMVLSYINNDKDYDVNHFKQILCHVQNTKNPIEINDNRLQQSVKYNGKRYIINSVKSEYGNLFYTVIMSRGIIVAQKSKQIILWLWIIVATLAMGVTFAFLFANVSYKPVKQIKKKIIDTEYIDPVGKNDFDYIRSSLEYLISKNTIMQNNIKDITDYLIFKLFKGEISNIDEINRLSKDFKLPLFTAGFKVCILAFDEYIDSDKAADYISELLPNEVSFVLRMTASKYIYSMIISFTSESQDSVIPFLKLLPEKISSLSIVAVGNIQNTIQRIPMSYREASVAFEYASVHRRSGIQFYDDIKYSCNNTNIIEKLSKHIDEHDENEVLEVLINIEKQLEEKHISIQNAQTLFIDLIILFICKCGDLNVKNSMFGYPNIFLIQEYSSVDNFIDMLRRLEIEYRMLFPKLRQKHYANLINNMKKYVNQHYANPEFSLEQMANEFNMTISSLSKFFKDITGTNINDYITELKIEKAKQLLGETNMPIYEIGMEVGYYNVNSFIRRFKQIVDKTPGEFRKENS